MACNLYKVPSGLTPVTIIYNDCDGVNQSVSVPSEEDDYYFCGNFLISAPGVEEIGSCSCICYSIYNPEPGEFTFPYIDCDGNGAGILIPPGITSFCSRTPVQAAVNWISFNNNVVTLFTGNTCSSGSCVCNCYSLTNNTGIEKQLDYIDRNGLLQTITLLENGGTQKVCSIGLAYKTPGYYPVTENIDIINEGPCIYPTTTDMLLHNLIKQLGPCPDICSGVTPVGGPAGTSTIDINTGYPI